MKYSRQGVSGTFALVWAAGILYSSPSHAQTVRIAAYNVNLDTDFGTSHPNQQADLNIVLQAMGSAKLSDNGTLHAQPLDILALEELPSGASAETTELQTIINGLNSVYGAGTYAYNNTADPTSGGTGGGPSAIIYNTKTVQVVSASATALGGENTSGAARAPMQYLIQPVAAPTIARFYVDVSHMKSDSSSGNTPNPDRRNNEATAITSDTATLGAGTHIIALGDFNIDGSSEQTYQTMRSAFDDPGNPAGTWDDGNNTNRRLIANLLTQNTDGMEYRDDIQFVSPSADHNSGIPGLQYDLDSITAFGNGGSSNLAENAVNSSSNPNPFPNDPEFSTLYPSLTTDLFNASDHLPMVADYDIVDISVPEPASLAILALGGIGLLGHRRRKK